MTWILALQLEEFLSRNPSMRLTKYAAGSIELEGIYKLDARMEGSERIRQSFELRMVFSRGYPKELPLVIETGRQLPRNLDHHTYKDGSLCLGSDIKLKMVLSDASTICHFVARVLEPFLYSLSYKIKYGVFPYGELAHGEAGLVHDYEILFHVKGKKAVLGVLEALGTRKRVANKLACPCGCRRRLGRCDYRFSLERWRRLDRRRWFREHIRSFKPIEKPKRKRKKRRVTSPTYSPNL